MEKSSKTQWWILLDFKRKSTTLVYYTCTSDNYSCPTHTIYSKIKWDYFDHRMYRVFEYNNMKQYVLFYHLQSVSVLHIPYTPLNLIDLSHITMKTSLNITGAHISSDHWIFTLDFCTGFYWIFVKNKN